MNGMGGSQPNPKLQAMMAGLMGNQAGGGPPQAGGPAPNQPTGFPQEVDPAYSGFTKIKQGMMALADMLTQLGDQISANQVQELAIELMKVGESRSSDMLKRMELDQKLGNSGAAVMGNPSPQAQGY